MHTFNNHFGMGMMRRRRFLNRLALAGAGALAVPPLARLLNADAGKNEAGIPLRTLGRTNQKVTILGLGSAPVGHSMPGRETGVPVFRAALEAGINYVDTARNYDDAEDYLGELIPQFRENIFLATKAQPRGNDPKTAAQFMQKQFEDSLRRLKTGHVDLLHIHSVGDQPPELILGLGGPLEFVRQMKQKGLTRFIGITAHNRPARLVELIETGEIDVIMVPVNFADYALYPFEQEILPVARKHRCGIVAMKVFGGHRNNFAGYRKRGPSKMPREFLERALRYSLGIKGIGSAVVGPYTIEEIKQDVEWAKTFQPLSAPEEAALRVEGERLAGEWGRRFGPAV
jgi:aryl-alcohol dehydrogenase-like predicted oxidoreductase